MEQQEVHRIERGRVAEGNGLDQLPARALYCTDQSQFCQPASACRPKFMFGSHLQVVGLLLKPGELIAADRGLIRSGGRCGCSHGGHGMTLCQHVKAQELREVACGALRKVPSPGPLSLGNRGAYNCRLIYLASVPTECPKP